MKKLFGSIKKFSENLFFGTNTNTLNGQTQDKNITFSEQTNNKTNLSKNSNKKPIPFNFTSPIQGKILPLSEVPDKVFSGKMMGDGFAIEPTRGSVVSPINGKVLYVFPTKHSIGLITEDGIEILIHFGINTVKLDGLGFKTLVKSGDTIKQGDKLLEVNLSYVRENATSTITPIVFTNGHTIELQKTGDVIFNEANIIKIKQENQA